MKCPNHLTREVAGYCCVCGSFYCEDCLTRHEANLYCRKHYKPIQEKMDQSQRLEAGRKRHARHALVVQLKSGQKAQGICRTMNIREPSFHLECEDKEGITTGEVLRIRFEDVKCVRHVKSYTGKFDPRESFQEFTPGGTDLVLEFKDGEAFRGKTMQAYNPDAPRFYIIPVDQKTNDINLLVETSALARSSTPEEYKERRRAAKAQAAEERKENEAPVEMGQDETMGDFYFEQHNYPSALEQYQVAFRKHPEASRLRKKVLVSMINVGIGSIKSRDYPTALGWMEKALELDPDNPHAKKKAKQLRKVIEKTQRRMKAYREGNLAMGKKDGEE